jgi:hypothetical protein
MDCKVHYGTAEEERGGAASYQGLASSGSAAKFSISAVLQYCGQTFFLINMNSSLCPTSMRQAAESLYAILDSLEAGVASRKARLRLALVGQAAWKPLRRLVTTAFLRHSFMQEFQFSCMPVFLPCYGRLCQCSAVAARAVTVNKRSLWPDLAIVGHRIHMTQ